MDRTLVAVQRMLAALDAPAYDLGILSDRGMLPGLSNLPTEGVLSRWSDKDVRTSRIVGLEERKPGEYALRSQFG